MQGVWVIIGGTSQTHRQDSHRHRNLKLKVKTLNMLF